MPLRHRLARTLGRLGACLGALVLLAMLTGLVEAHPHDAPGDPPVGVAGDAHPFADGAQAECPHETGHQHADGECCLGPGCAPALVPGGPLPAELGHASTILPLGASAVLTGVSGGHFRPPRAFPAA